MKLRHLLIIEAIISIATGLGILFLPATILSLYRLATDPVGLFMSQNAGGLCLSLGVIAWVFRNITELEIRKAIATSFLIYHTSLLGVTVYNWLFAPFNFGLGWGSVTFEGIFSLAFAYFRFVKR